MHHGKKVLVLALLSGLCFAVALGAAAGKKHKAAAPKTNGGQEKPKNGTVRNAASEEKKAAAGIAQKAGRVKAAQRVSTPRKRTSPTRRKIRTTTPVYDENYDDTYPKIPLRNRNKKLPPGMMVVFAPLPPRKPIKRPIFLNKLSTRTTPDWTNYPNPSPEEPFWPGSEQWNNQTVSYYQFWTTHYPNYNWSTFYQDYNNNYTTENYYYYNNYSTEINYYYNNYTHYSQEYSPGFSPSYENAQNYTSWPQIYYQPMFTTVFPNYNWSAVYGNYSTFQSDDWSTFPYGNYSDYTTMAYF
ncbi:Hypothetical predicted protein [Cloeon dipterum]|uniref:Uncharacterized protein n=1 Tax=Cloeon dipterum TaxID=197152 RepID=A0A8S1CTU9_9INSE|nr:Hypothetical predicted protein [Cloeon dipterum]